MFSNVLEFEYFIYVPLNVLELMAVFVNVLENIIFTLPCISAKFLPYHPYYYTKRMLMSPHKYVLF